MPALCTTLDDVDAAERRIGRYLRPTPILESTLLNERLGFRLLLKAECLRETGAFKLNGALSKLSTLSEAEWRRGVVAGSAGNHAKGLARAGQLLGVPVTILMPDDAPEIKKADTIAYGAKVELCRRDGEDRDLIVARMAKERGLVIAHSYNDPHTIAGQGLIGKSIFNQCQDMQCQPDVIIVNCSGGGLTSGIALSRDLYASPPQIYTAEPEGFDDAKRSLELGSIQGNAKTSGSICDALLLKLGDLTFPILEHHKVKGLVASDLEVQAAMSLAADELKLVLEPGGAVSLAVACLNRESFKGKTVVVVASGSNVDSQHFAEHIKVGAMHRHRLVGGLSL